jgi:flagellar hook-basal body complex protein FliE
MSLETIAAIAPTAVASIDPAALPSASTAGGAGFSNLVSQGLEQVNQQLMTSQTDLQQLAVGDVQNLHQIMIRMEETRMSFQLALQIRSRLLEAYQDVMKMQV